MNLSALRDAFRVRADDTVSPFLWEDGELDLYLNEAQREAAIRAQLLKDSTTSAVTQIAVTAGTTDYALHTSILRVERVKLASQAKPLERETTASLDATCPGWETLEGAPTSYIEENGRIRLVPKSSIDDTLNLVVYRLPLVDMKVDEDSPEIHAQHHHRLVDWALRCAYLKADEETYDAQAAARNEQAFEASFGVRPDANVQRKQRENRDSVVQINW